MRTTAGGVAIALAIAGAGCGAMHENAPSAMAPTAEAARGDEAAFAGAASVDELVATATIAGRDVGEPAALDAAALNAAKTGDWAATREFAVPVYDPNDTGPRRDFRETIFWSPSVKTDVTGKATITFPTSDAITGFRVTAEGITGGAPGHGEVAFASKLPVSLAANVPVAVTTGDRIALPVTITNNTGAGIDATVHATTGEALVVAGDPVRALHVPAHAVRTVQIAIDVRGADGANGAGDIEFALEAGAASDKLRRTVTIEPNGFPAEASFAGTLDGKARHTIALPTGVVAGSVHTHARVYPSPVATMTVAADSMIREPGGCFEQASSSNYPNVMVLQYLNATGADTSGIAQQATSALQHGYQILTGYGTSDHGYDWFGDDPGHEALTAYGVLEFREMAKVYPDVDRAMITKAVDFLRSKRDGNGGYERSSKQVDSFGQASPEVTDAYITYALAEAGEKDLDKELARARSTGKQTKDPYVLALSAAAVLAIDPGDAAGKTALTRLAKLQSEDGHFGGAAESITRSSGAALDIETTAFAVLALMKSKAAYGKEIDRALAWITTQRDQWGGFASTQATILALKALTMGAAPKLPANASVTIAINGTDVATTTVDPDGGAIELPDLGPHLAPGDNVIELRGSKGLEVEYSVGASWYDAAPTSDDRTAVAVTTALGKRRLRAGRGVTLTATLENVTATDQPMTIARIGIPGGLKYQTWQLDELVKRKVVDFVETREREVVLYYRGLAPHAKKQVGIELLAQVPGAYVAPPSSAYLYYTDELRRYAPPLAVEIQKPAVRKKKKPVVAAPTAATTGGAP